MRRVVLITVMCAFAFVATPVLADFYAGTANLNQTGTVDSVNYSSGNGGEFTISNSSLSISAYVPGVTSGITGNPNSFQTFCVEMTEYTASTVDIMVSDTWVGTKPQWDPSVPHSPASHAIKGSESVGDDLNPQTAYLYTLFAMQSLTGYDYGTGRSASAGNLQMAIWYIEGEWTSSLTPQASAWVQQAVDATGLDIGTSFLDQTIGDTWGQTIGNVRILNTWKPGHINNFDEAYYRRQDQLYLTPIPASLILGLLGLGVVGLKLRKYA